jgi:phosphoribosyl 1,2-cyclic phosphodiesterase
MITPNIENIIKSLVVKAGVMEMGEKIAWGSDTALMRQAAAALQTQAERIKELEAEIITRTSYGDEQTDFAIKLAAERDALRAALANAEPTNSYDLAKRADNGGQP